MTEALVQWTLLNNLDFLSTALNFNIARIIGQEITTDFGRLDFILSNFQNKHLVVELETNLNTKEKLNYCFNQTLNYKNVKFTKDTDYCILFSDETNSTNKKEIKKFGKENSILIYSYSIEKTQKLYIETVKRLSLNVGLALPNPKNYTICYLRWLNKVMKPFYDKNKKTLTFEEISKPFNNPIKSKTNFNCHKRIALDFELIVIENENYILTKYGELFVENLNPYISSTSNVSSISLTNEQKRILIKILTNGNWENKVHKVNIYWFLRFIEVTDGTWFPKVHNFELSKQEIAKSLFRVSYKGRTLHEFLTWCSNYCLELGLIQKIKSTSEYDRIFLTPFGVEINNIISMDLTLKRYRMNLSFKFLD